MRGLLQGMVNTIQMANQPNEKTSWIACGQSYRPIGHIDGVKTETPEILLIKHHHVV